MMKNKYKKMMNDIKPEPSLNEKIFSHLEKPPKRFNYRPLTLVLSVVVVFALIYGSDGLSSFLNRSVSTDGSLSENAGNNADNEDADGMETDNYWDGSISQIDIGQTTITIHDMGDYNIEEYHFADDVILTSYTSTTDYVMVDVPEDFLITKFEYNGTYFVLTGPQHYDRQLAELKRLLH